MVEMLEIVTRNEQRGAFANIYVQIFLLQVQTTERDSHTRKERERDRERNAKISKCNLEN